MIWSELNVPACFQVTWTLCVVQYCELKSLYGEHMLTEKNNRGQHFLRHGAALQGGPSDACWRLDQPLQTNTSTDCFRQDIHWNDTCKDVYI